MQYMAKMRTTAHYFQWPQFATDLLGSCEVPGQAIAAVMQVLDV